MKVIQTILILAMAGEEKHWHGFCKGLRIGETRADESAVRDTQFYIRLTAKAPLVALNIP